jgi:hypothetical protein
MQQRDQSVGRPYPGYTVRIEHEGRLDRAARRDRTFVDRRGARAPIFQEYVDNPQAMAETFDARGFFRTGDRKGPCTRTAGSSSRSRQGHDQGRRRKRFASKSKPPVMSAGGVAEVQWWGDPIRSMARSRSSFVVLPAGSAPDTAARIADIAAARLANSSNRAEVIKGCVAQDRQQQGEPAGPARVCQRAIGFRRKAEHLTRRPRGSTGLHN